MSAIGGTIEVGARALGAVTHREFSWLARPGAVVACRWQDGDAWPSALLDADALGLTDGVTYRVVAGKVQP
jgi:hypothetical protein